MNPALRAGARWAVHLAALYPLARAIWDFKTGGLTANPIEDVTRRVGHAALSSLIATLAVSPLVQVSGWKWIAILRRPLGLYSFAYATAHLFIFAGLDYGFDWALILAEAPKKRFIIAGLAAYIMLAPLAATSPGSMKLSLGGNWRDIHRLIYPAALTAGLHFVWLTKGAKTRPMVYLLLILILLAARAAPGRRPPVSPPLHDH